MAPLYVGGSLRCVSFRGPYSRGCTTSQLANDKNTSGVAIGMKAHILRFSWAQLGTHLPHPYTAFIHSQPRFLLISGSNMVMGSKIHKTEIDKWLVLELLIFWGWAHLQPATKFIRVRYFPVFFDLACVGFGVSENRGLGREEGWSVVRNIPRVRACRAGG